MAKTAKEAIIWAYTNPDSIASFSTAAKVLKEVRKQFPKTSLTEVEDTLQRIPTYTRNRKRRIKFKRLQTVPSGFMSDVQMDLADFQDFAAQNDNFKYILVCMDVLSRRFFAAPVKSKASIHMIPAFNRYVFIF